MTKFVSYQLTKSVKKASPFFFISFNPCKIDQDKPGGYKGNDYAVIQGLRAVVEGDIVITRRKKDAVE
jgi:hypothetical protein